MDNINMNETKYITVLDFEVGRIFQYEVPAVLNELAINNEDYEYYLTEKGHRLSNIEWMEHDIKEIVDHTIKSTIKKDK